MDLYEIIKRFSIISGLSSDEIAPWTSLCEDACMEIRKNLRENVVEEDHSRRLNAAAAALAFYRYILYRCSGGGMEAFTAGEIRIKTDSKVTAKMAYNIWMDAKRSVSDLLQDNEFMFERII